MKRDQAKKEKAYINQIIPIIDNIPNTVPSGQKHTYNFKGRKSSVIAGEVMSHITPNKGKVCDPFTGSCAFAVAAAEHNLDFYGTEIDNYTFDVNKALFTKCDINSLINFFNTISNSVKQTVLDLYQTECCGKKNYISKLHFDPEGECGFENPEYYHPTQHRDIINNETIILAEACPICKKKRKIFEKIDQDKIEYTNTLDISKFPKHNLIENSRINITAKHDADRYDRNFTNRAKYALLSIQEAILTLPESTERDVLEHCLVASLTLARTCQYGSGSEYIYQVMRKQAQEKNVWELFSDKVSAFIKFKQEYAHFQYADINDNSNSITLKNQDFRVFLSDYNSYFDTIYTDPPYTDQVPYLERSQLYRDWLHAFYDNDNKYKLTTDMLSNEVVITNAPSRSTTKYSDVQYFNDIDKMFSCFYKALKPDGRVVLTVKLGSNAYLKTLAEYIKYARKNGFEYITLKKIEKKDPTLRKQAAIKNTMMDEMLLFFVKLDEDSVYWYHGNRNLEVDIVTHLYNYLIKKNDNENPFTSFTECISTTQQFLNHNYNILPNEQIQNKIRKVINENFSVVESTFVYINPNKIYLTATQNQEIFAGFYDIIPTILRTFDAELGFTKEDLYFEIINTIFDGNENLLDQIIEAEKHESQINTLLDNYCEMNDDKRYYFKRQQSAIDIVLKDISSLDGYEFEDVVKELLEKKGFYDVIRIGGAGDRGVDIMAKRKNDNIEEGYIIQCKRWFGNVGSTPIQRLHSMMIQMSKSVQHAICITTSDYTAEGKAMAKNTGVKIINGIELMKELDIHLRGRYYHALLDCLK